MLLTQYFLCGWSYNIRCRKNNNGFYYIKTVKNIQVNNSRAKYATYFDDCNKRLPYAKVNLQST